jgi:hypothetical protein
MTVVIRKGRLNCGHKFAGANFSAILFRAQELQHREEMKSLYDMYWNSKKYHPTRNISSTINCKYNRGPPPINPIGK